MNNFKKTGGFTLVELIVVIAILGILAAVAIPAYSGYIKKANDATVVTELTNVKTAAEAANATAGQLTAVVLNKDGDVEITASTFAAKFAEDFAVYYPGKTLTRTPTDAAQAATKYTVDTSLTITGLSVAPDSSNNLKVGANGSLEKVAVPAGN